MSYNDRRNYLTGNVLSDEWYSPQFLVNKCFEIAKSSGLLMLPFDTQESNFTKTAENLEIDNINSIQDFLDNNYEYDYLITNPPFSIKEKVIEKCLQDGKEFILVLPQTYLFSVGFYDLLQKYDFHYKVYSPKQRVYFIDQNGNQNRPNFHSVILQVHKDFVSNEIIHFYSEV